MVRYLKKPQKGNRNMDPIKSLSKYILPFTILLFCSIPSLAKLSPQQKKLIEGYAKKFPQLESEELALGILKENGKFRGGTLSNKDYKEILEFLDTNKAKSGENEKVVRDLKSCEKAISSLKSPGCSFKEDLSRPDLLPTPVKFDKKSEECQNWLLAHKELCSEEDYQAAKALLDQVQYIDFPTFKKQLNKVFHSFVERLPHDGNGKKKKFFLIYMKNKSTEWIKNLLAHPLSNLEHEPVDYTRNWAEKVPEGAHVVVIDDAVYSGEQIESYFIDTAGKKNIHLDVVVPYSTELGKTRIINAVQKRSSHTLDVQFSPDFEKISTLKEKLAPEHVKSLLKRYNQNDFSELGSTALFFQHKSPDYRSAWPGLFWRGAEVACAASNTEKNQKKYPKFSETLPPVFECIPNIVPPYYPPEIKEIYLKYRSLIPYYEMELEQMPPDSPERTDFETLLREHKAGMVKLRNNLKTLRSSGGTSGH